MILVLPLKLKKLIMCFKLRTAVENILKKAKLQVGDDYAVELRSV